MILVLVVMRLLFGYYFVHINETLHRNIDEVCQLDSKSFAKYKTKKKNKRLNKQSPFEHSDAMVIVMEKQIDIFFMIVVMVMIIHFEF